jgi:hypothetical protein
MSLLEGLCKGTSCPSAISKLLVLIQQGFAENLFFAALSELALSVLTLILSSANSLSLNQGTIFIFE